MKFVLEFSQNSSPLSSHHYQRHSGKRKKTNFCRKWNYLNYIGALDGKNVVTEKPPNSGSTYFDYKKEFSVVLMALFDDALRFITVDVGF